MAAGDEGEGGEGCRSFSIIVKESKDHAVQRQDTRPNSPSLPLPALPADSAGSPVDRKRTEVGGQVTALTAASPGKMVKVQAKPAAAGRYVKSTSSLGSRESRVDDLPSLANGAATETPTTRGRTSGSKPKGRRSSRVGVETAGQGSGTALDLDSKRGTDVDFKGGLNMDVNSKQGIDVDVDSRPGWSVVRVRSTDTDRKFRHRHRRLWYRLRRRHLHMGVVEINSRHPFYHRLLAISAGFQSVRNDAHSNPPLDNLEDHHYHSILRKELSIPSMTSGKSRTTFVFESYAPSVFATIRRAVSVEEDSFMESMISQSDPYLEFISNSRSGQDFFLSCDMKYLIKTNKENDVFFLLNILREYLQHFQCYPHSLLVKYLGCYSLKFPGKKKVYFLVMQNIFYPADRIEDRYDIKGCTSGRYQEPDPPGSNTIIVLKDQNFIEESVELGSNRDWFIQQLTADSTFLRNMNVMDYSLLIGRQKLHPSEKTKSLPDLVSRLQRSKVALNDYAASSQASLCSECGHTPRTDLDAHTPVSSEDPLEPRGSGSPLRSLERENPPVLEPGGSGFTGQNTQRENPLVLEPRGTGPARQNGLHFPHSLTENGDENRVAEDDWELSHQGAGLGRRRLLPDCSNPLHIVDGPEFRYFFGIVDFLTRWTLRQKAARLWKMVKYGCGQHSTMPPDHYSQRFLTFIATHVR